MLAYTLLFFTGEEMKPQSWIQALNQQALLPLALLTKKNNSFFFPLAVPKNVIYTHPSLF